MTSGRATRRRNELKRSATTGRQTAALSRRLGAVAWTVALLVITALVIVGLNSARPTESADVRPAPAFTLASTAGGTVSLSDFRGKPVVLYFSEGAGCDSCLVQMAEIERNGGFDAAGIQVVPIVMNTREQIIGDMRRLGVQTPFLLDDGTVSAAYGTLGAGMHAGLPGHGFVLIDPEGMQRWHGDYPSMWLAPDDLLGIVLERI